MIKKTRRFDLESPKAQIRCSMCKYVVHLPITQDELTHWSRNRSELPNIQNHFPELDLDEREVILSDMCGECFDKLWPETEAEFPRWLNEENKND